MGVELNFADWLILGIIVVSGLLSLMRGFAHEAMSLASWGIAFLVAVAAHSDVELWLQQYVGSAQLRDIIAYALPFGVTLVSATLLTNMVVKLIKSSGLGGTDRLLGMFFGFARGGVVVLVLVILLPSLLTSINQEPWWQTSYFIPEFESASVWATQTGTELLNWIQDFIGRHSSGSDSAAPQASAVLHNFSYSLFTKAA